MTAMVIVVCIAQASPAGATDVVRLVSATPGGAGGNAHSDITSTTSETGRYVAFQSAATDLVNTTYPPGANIHVFVRDMLTGTTQLVDISSDGLSAGDFDAGNPLITPDGRYVVFTSLAQNLVGGGLAYTLNAYNVYIRDLQTQTTKIVSVNPAGTAGGNGSSGADSVGTNTMRDYAVSADGRYVTFSGAATNLTALPDANALFDVFVRDVQAGTTSLVTVNAAGTAAGDKGGQLPLMSADGRYVFFESSSTDLGATSTTSQIYVRDLQSSTTTLLSHANGTPGTAPNAQSSEAASVTPDGRYVVFASSASDLTPGGVDGNAAQDVFRADRVTGTVALVSFNAAGTNSVNGGGLNAQITPDGRYVLFDSGADAPDLTGGGTDGNGSTDVFRRDMQTNTTVLVSATDQAGTTTPASAGALSTVQLDGLNKISADGRFVAFRTRAPSAFGLLEGNTLGALDAFVRDIQTGTTKPLNRSTAAGPATTTNKAVDSMTLSANGRVAIVETAASDLGPDANGAIITDYFWVGNFPPTASFTATPSSLSAAFDASASTDPENALVSYAWDFGDGAGGTGATASHTYAAAGTYTARLTVTDEAGITDTTTRMVTVTAPAGGGGGAGGGSSGGSGGGGSGAGVGQPPYVTLGGPNAQRVVKRGEVHTTARCVNEACVMTLRGIIVVPGRKTFTLRRIVVTLRRGESRDVGLELSRRALRAVRRALERGHGKVWATVFVIARDSAGRESPAKKIILVRL